MPKPDYAALFAQIAIETDPVVKEQLRLQAYNFSPPVPLPEGETVEDYLLTPHEQELFAYTYDGYIENNPGYFEGNYSTSVLYTIPDYAAYDYINIEYPAIGLYVAAGYTEEEYMQLTDTSIGSGFISYVGEYYNELGETT